MDVCAINRKRHSQLPKSLAPSQDGFVLLVVVGILALFTILASALAPNFSTWFDRQTTDFELKNLAIIGDGTQIYLRRNFSWPPDLASHSPDYVSLSPAELFKNPKGYSRYFFIHPTVVGLTNQTGLSASDLLDARFLLISDFSQDAAPVITNAAEFQNWWTMDTSGAPDLHLYHGNMAYQFHQVTVTATGDGGSYQIAGSSTNSNGGRLAAYSRYHLAGTSVLLDESVVYGYPEVSFTLTTDVAFAFIPCLPAGGQWRIAPGPVCPVLWISTKDKAKGAPGLSSWTKSQIVAFIDPDLTYEPGSTGTTNGNFGLTFDLDDFTGGANIDAMHYVARPVTVGGLDLLVGDLLLSTEKNQTLRSTNSLSVKTEDLFGFRPDVVNNYSSGTFFMVIDGSDLDLKKLKGIALVELDTTVGDALLSAGTFLLTGDQEKKKQKGGDSWNSKDVYQFVPTSAGTNTSGALTLFMDTSDINISEKVIGLELLEAQTDMGDVTLQAGQILVSLDKDDDSVGDNRISTKRQDVFILDLSSAGTNTSGNATLLFDGSDVGMKDKKENINGLTLNGIKT